MDKAPSHYSDEIREIFQQNSSSYVLFHGGQTKFLQPLDISINKPFKSELRKKYSDFQINNNNSSKP